MNTMDLQSLLAELNSMPNWKEQLALLQNQQQQAGPTVGQLSGYAAEQMLPYLQSYAANQQNISAAQRQLMDQAAMQGVAMPASYAYDLAALAGGMPSSLPIGSSGSKK